MMDVDAIYRTYGLAVFRRCARILRDDAEAEDVAHEVFVRALDGLPAREEEAMAWLYRVGTNLCLNRLRDRGRRAKDDWQARVRDTIEESGGGGAALGGGSGDGRSPERAAIERELVLQLMGGLDEEQQALAVYHFVDGMSQGEIAEVVGLARGTVNRKLAELCAIARARLAEVPS